MGRGTGRLAARWAKWALAIVIMLVALYTVVGFLVAPTVIRRVLEHRMSERFERPVRLGGVTVNPFSLSATVRDIHVAADDEGAPLFSAERLSINMHLKSVWRRAAVVQAMRLEAPALRLVRRADGSLNITDLFEPSQEDDADSPASYSFGRIEVSGGRISFEDEATERRHEATDLELMVPAFSTFGDPSETAIEPHFAGRLDGQPFRISGRMKPFADQSEAQVAIVLTDLPLTPWLAWWEAPRHFEVTSGTLSMNVELLYREGGEQPTGLSVAGDITLRGLAMRRTDGTPLGEVGRLDLKGMQYHRRDNRLETTALLLDSPRVLLALASDRTFNFAQLFPEQEPEAQARQESRESGRPALDVLIGEARVRDGILAFRDAGADPEFFVALEALNIHLGRIDSASGKPIPFRLHAMAAEGEALAAQGQLQTRPFRMKGSIDLTHIGVPRFAPYFRRAVDLDLRGGALSISCQFMLAARPTGFELVLRDADALAESFEAIGPGSRPLATLPAARLSGGAFDLQRRLISVEQAAFIGLDGHLVRMADGRLNIRALRLREPPDEPSAPWTVEVERLRLRDGTLRFADEALRTPAMIEMWEVSLLVNDFSTRPERAARMALDARLPEAGRLWAMGSANLRPLRMDMEIGASNISAAALQPYLGQTTHLKLRSGAAEATGVLTLTALEEQPLTAAWKGRARFNDVSIGHENEDAEVFAVRVLTVSDGAVISRPLSVRLESVEAEGLSVMLTIDEKGAVLWRRIRRAEAPEAQEDRPSAPREEGPQPFYLNRVVLHDGRAIFVDRAVEPFFTSRVLGVRGEITSAYTPGRGPAWVDVQGLFQRTAPLRINGRALLYTDPRRLDLALNLRDVQLAPFTPYAARYLGYTIDRGRLGVRSRLLIEGRRIDMNSEVVIDQLAFGDSVKSPDAADFPVLIAVEVLKDRSGQIQMEVPVTGTRDDPEFSIRQIVVQTLMNVLRRAATSPLAFTRSLLERGTRAARRGLGIGRDPLGDVESVHFQYGLAYLTEEARRQMDEVAKALASLPEINLILEGDVDPVYDTAGLRHALLDRAIREQKFGILQQYGAAPTSAEEVVVEPEEYPAYLVLAYSAAGLPPGEEKALSLEEMRDRLLQEMVVTDAELVHLAERRSTEVRRYLVQYLGLPPHQIFLADPLPIDVTGQPQVTFRRE